MWDLIFLLALIILFIGFTEKNDSSQAENGLEIIEATQAIGSVDGVNDTRVLVYNYDFLIYNRGNEEVNLDSVEPLFQKDFSSRVITEDHKIVGNKTIKPHSSIHVKGQVEFNASGLSKEQILILHGIYSVNVTSTKTLLFPEG